MTDPLDFTGKTVLVVGGTSGIGNGIAHTTWAIRLGTYFPGLYTALVYWILGPLLLNRLLGNAKATAVLCGGFLIVLVTLLCVAMEAG